MSVSTFSAVASSFAWAYNNSTSWTWEGAFQGRYGSQQLRDGVIFFNTLRSTVNWADMDVKAVRLWLRFGDAGGARSKWLGIYGSSQNTVSGATGAGMRGVGITLVKTNNSAWKSEDVITFDSTTNSYYLQYWKNWIENTTSNGLVFYYNDPAPATNTYSDNYLIITAAGIVIDYELKGSTGTVSPSSVDAGDTVTITLNPIDTDGTLTHSLEWQLGSASTTVSLAEGITTADFQIPYSWLNQLTGVESGEAKCIISTYVDGTLTGTRETTFTVNVPSSYAPVINSFSVRRYITVIDDQAQVSYEESLSGNHVWVSLDISITPKNEYNTGTAYIRYYSEEDPDTIYQENLTWSNSSLIYVGNSAAGRGLIDEEISLGESWVFELTTTNGHTTRTATSRVEMSWAPLHVAGTGYGVGIGMYSDGTRTSPKFQVGWPSIFEHGIVGVTNFSTDEVETGGTWIDGSPLYTRTIVVTITSTGSTDSAAILGDVDKILNFSGVLVSSNGSQRPINWSYSSSLYCGVYRFANNSYITINSGETGTAYVTILYTKVSS